MYFESRVVFIDMTQLAEILNDLRLKIYFDNFNKKFLGLMNQFQLNHALINLADFVDVAQIAQQFKTVSAGTDFQEDFLKILEKKVLIKYCLANKIDRLILNENLEQLATRAFKLLCKSRQNEMVSQCSAVFEYEFQEGKISILRPLASVSNKEIYYYTHFNKIIAMSGDIHDWLEKSKQGSLNTLLAEFVLDQQREFIATASNVQQTVEKLKESILSIDKSRVLPECSFCLTVS